MVADVVEEIGTKESAAGEHCTQRKWFTPADPDQIFPDELVHVLAEIPGQLVGLESVNVVVEGVEGFIEMGTVLAEGAK